MSAQRSKRARLLTRWFVISGIILVAAATWSLAKSRQAGDVVLPGEQVEGLTSVLTRDLGGAVSPLAFADITSASGIDFRHFPRQRESQLPEDMGSGVACGDYDGDGRTDLYFVNFSGNVRPGAPLDDDLGRSRLYRNIDGRQFEDVTEQAGVGFVGFGMGAAWGDHDDDGDLDLYVTAFGNNVLYDNDGDGTFSDATERCRVQDSRFSAGCSWADFDLDGDLDLYVCNYVDFAYQGQPAGRMVRQYASEQPFTLNPSAYPPQPNSLFQNQGDGTFDEVGRELGVSDPEGKSLAAAWVDLDNDRFPDLYVANDVSNNGVFRNAGGMLFEDIGAPSLAADYRGAMGIGVADLDDDMDLDLLVTHWVAQENALFRNMLENHDGRAQRPDEPARRRLWFMDHSAELGLGQSSLEKVGWATGFCDFDNDSMKDLWLVNGSTLEVPEEHTKLEPQVPLVFWRKSQGEFVEAVAQVLATPLVCRGGAHLDVDGDGGVDLVVVVHGGDAILLRNTCTSRGQWVSFRLRQTGGNSHAIGARVEISAGGKKQMAEVGAGAPYLSQSELDCHFGLGDSGSVETLRIVWPDGEEETHPDLAAGRRHDFTHHATYGR